MASNATFYNWLFSFIFFSIIMVAAASMVQEMAVPYQNFTTVNASPTFYIVKLQNLSVMGEINGTANRILETLNPQDQNNTITFGPFKATVPQVLIDISTFGIVLFQSVGAVISIVFQSLQILPDSIRALAEAMKIPSYLMDIVLVLAVIAIGFTMVRAVTKTREI